MLNGTTEKTTGDVPEKEILRRASSGDQDAFGDLYQRYVGKIYTYVFYRTGNHHDAEDLTARVFVRALRHIPNYQDRGLPFSAWLYRIAHNLVANWHRDNSRKPEVPLEDIPYIPADQQMPESSLLHREEQASLLRLIRKLPAERQQLLVLKFVENYSNAEIGTIMGRTEGAIKSLYHRTLLALRDQADHYFTPEPD